MLVVVCRTASDFDPNTSPVRGARLMVIGRAPHRDEDVMAWVVPVRSMKDLVGLVCAESRPRLRPGDLDEMVSWYVAETRGASIEVFRPGLVVREKEVVVVELGPGRRDRKHPWQFSSSTPPWTIRLLMKLRRAAGRDSGAWIHLAGRRRPRRRD